MLDRIRELFRSLTRRPRGKRLLVCPRCESKKIRLADSISGFITPPLYFCPDCYYIGYFIVEIDKEEEQSKE